MIVGLSFAAWLAWSGGAILCGRAIGIEIGLVEALFLAGVVNLGVAIPSSPGFVGTYQWLVISTLALYGEGRVDGLAFRGRLPGLLVHPDHAGRRGAAAPPRSRSCSHSDARAPDEGTERGRARLT